MRWGSERTHLEQPDFCDETKRAGQTGRQDERLGSHNRVELLLERGRPDEAQEVGVDGRTLRRLHVARSNSQKSTSVCSTNHPIESG